MFDILTEVWIPIVGWIFSGLVWSALVWSVYVSRPVRNSQTYIKVDGWMGWDGWLSPSASLQEHLPVLIKTVIPDLFQK